MGRVEAYYPAQTEKIAHVGKSGNSYRIDAIDIPVRLEKVLRSNREFNINEVSGHDPSVLYNAHSAALIESYRTGSPFKLANSSGLMWQKGFYQWVLNKAWASIDAMESATKRGRSLAITSGGHHAERDTGYGFGPISNMVIGMRELLKGKIIGRAAVLDLDVHFANGTHSQVRNDRNILSCDLWKYRLPKWTYTYNSGNIFHLKVGDARDYLEKLDLMFTRIIDFKPDLLLLYNGLDVLDDDRMGGVKGFDSNVLRERSSLLKGFIQVNNLPTCVFVGGGYLNYTESVDKIEESRQRLVELFVESISTILSRSK